MARRRRATRTTTTSAAHAVVVVALTLLAASFLNAPGLRKTAQIQPRGTERDVSIWLTSRLVDVSHSLYLDRPRHALKAAIGRSGDDVIDTRVVLKPIPKPARSPHTRSPHTRPPLPRVTYTPSRPLRVWVAGDSLAEVPGRSLERITGQHTSIDVLAVESRLATGLTRPDVYNWFTRLRRAVPELRPRVAVLSFGADDSHDYVTGVPAGRTVGPIGSVSWGVEYRRRVAGVTRELNAAGVYVVWLGAPISRNPARNVRFRFIDHILSSVARGDRKGAAYVDTYSLFARGGQYRDYLPDRGGRLVLMRAPDGIHYTTPAGDLIAKAVIARLGHVFALAGSRSAHR